MFRLLTGKNNAIPSEYRKIAENLFPSDGFASVKKLNPKAAAEYAKALGNVTEYQRILSLDRASKEMHDFLGSFQNNLDLLIQKTWVEKADEERKGKLQDEIPPFMALIEQGDFQQALEAFGAILDELAYLFFGAQSTGADFSEYTFRIDAQIGLFWWYGSKLRGLKEISKDIATANEFLWAVLLIGICYLTDF